MYFTWIFSKINSMKFEEIILKQLKNLMRSMRFPYLKADISMPKSLEYVIQK